MKNSKLVPILAGAVIVGCGPAQDTGPTLPEGGGSVVEANGQQEPLQFPKDEFRGQRPKAGEPRDFRLPKVQTFRLANAIDVFLVERHQLPTVSVSMSFDGGSVLDPTNKVGMASVCMSMMSEGTRRLDKLALKAELADIGSSISSGADSDRQQVSMSTLSKHLDKTLALYAETLRTPAFRKAELDRMISRRLEALKQRKASPGSIAGRLLTSIMVGPRHPRGRVVTEAALARVRPADCKAYHRNYIRPKGARMFVVGDMTEAQVRKAFAPILAKWKGKPRNVAKMPDRKLRNGRIFFVHVPGAAQSSIYMVHPGPKRLDDNYFATTMMSAVLGGGFASRINMNLREDKGYSYGARGSFSYNKDMGTFYAASSVRTNATLQSLREMKGEIKRMKTGAQPATQAELTREKNGAILGLPARFATARQALNQYSSLAYYGLPLDYYGSYVGKVRKVDLAQVAAAARRELKPQRAQLLVVGDAFATQQVRRDGKDVDLEIAGKPASLVDALRRSAKSGEFGKGALVFLDKDGRETKAPSKQ